MTTPPIRTISPVNTVIKAPQQIWSAGTGIQPLIVNNDPLNTLYVGSKADVYRQDVSSTIPIEPLGSQEWGDYDIYAFAPVAVNTMLIIPGATAWNPSPAQVAISAAGLATAANQTSQLGQGNTLVTNTNLLGTGIALPTNAAQETGGNLATHTNLLTGAATGALISGVGRTVAQETAALIASGSAGGTAGGTPLLHGFAHIGGINLSVAAGATTANQTLTFTKTGFLINVRPQYSGASGATPFALLTLRWWDAPNAEDTYVITCVVKINASGVYSPLYITGPVRANQMLAKIQNFDAAQPITWFMDIWETTHHIARDDFRDSDIFGYTAPPGFSHGSISAPSSGILGGDINLNINAGATYTAILPEYAGEVQYSYNTNGGPIVVNIGYFIPNTGALGSNLLWNETVGGAAALSHRFIHPRTPVVISFTNNAAGALRVTWSANYQEYAS